MRSLDSIHFDVADMAPQGEHDGVRWWTTSQGAAVALYYFPQPPDIPVDPGSKSALGESMQALASTAGAALVDLDTPRIGRCVGVRQIVKLPQDPHGMSWIASLTLPFHDFSYVIKVQAAEGGITGERETVVCNEKIASGEVAVDADRNELRGWMSGPFAAVAPGQLARCLADDERYDERFPTHPLSIVRRTLARIERTLEIDPEIAAEPPFHAAAVTNRRPWWKFR